nr:unnamed protein product [Callosobruchus chinensis]
MSFRSHIDHVCDELNRAYYAISEVKSYLSQDTLMSVYYAVVHSHLSYNVMFWGQPSRYVRVLRAQEKILRMIFNLCYYESCRTLLKAKRILTLLSMFMLKCVCHMKKCLSMFEVQGERRNYNIRCTALKIPKFKTSMFKTSPHYYNVTLYNALPENVISIDFSVL